MSRRFVVVSGVPGSGKSTLARRLAPALSLALIDKDDILERLFAERGAIDATRRRELSRKSDVAFQTESAASEGAVLVSHWHLPGMPADSGTSTEWLSALEATLVNVHCVCPPEIAARRFTERTRHPSHLDHAMDFAALLKDLHSLALLGSPAAGVCLQIYTITMPALPQLVRDIDAAFRAARRQ